LDLAFGITANYDIGHVASYIDILEPFKSERSGDLTAAPALGPVLVCHKISY
jgi:hypothetical protein